MASNSFGRNFRFTTFGESHGVGIGVVVDGVPPKISLDEARIQEQLDRRRPGQSALTTQRQEADRVEIWSGVYEGQTTGAPVMMVIRNTDQRPKDYSDIAKVFRPGHADYTYHVKYGIRDPRGGRSSGRETAARVAAGALARLILEPKGIRITGHVVQVGGVRAERFLPETIEQNPVRCADPDAAVAMAEEIERARADKDSVGAVVEVIAEGVPAGLGDPVYEKLDARLAYALMSIGSIKGVEIGEGFAAAAKRGSESNDSMRPEGFVTNHAGGVLGGISTGAPVVARLAVKPASSIGKEQQTVDLEGNPVAVAVEGRHDPCIAPRVVPVAEAMVALVLTDFLL